MLSEDNHCRRGSGISWRRWPILQMFMSLSLQTVCIKNMTKACEMEPYLNSTNWNPLPLLCIQTANNKEQHWILTSPKWEIGSLLIKVDYLGSFCLWRKHYFVFREYEFTLEHDLSSCHTGILPAQTSCLMKRHGIPQMIAFYQCTHLRKEA